MAKAKQILRAIGFAGDGSPAKAVADAALNFSGISQTLHENEKKWSEFSSHVEEQIASLLTIVPDMTAQPDDVRKPLEQLKTALDTLVTEAREYQEAREGNRITALHADPNKLNSLSEKFDRVLDGFKFKFGISERLDVARILETVKDISRLVPDLAAKLEDIDSRWHGGPDAVHHLPYAAGTSWDPEKTCMDGTRKELLSEVWEWIRAGESADRAEMFWIVDVAGSGKSAIAHTVCERAKQEGLLLSSFFFDTAYTNRNNPDRVVTTLARNLARLDTRIAAAMGRVLEDDAGLRSAPITRQFTELILNPAAVAHYPRDRLYVIVFDALDEGCNRSLLTIFKTYVPALPGLFRIVVTSRPEPELVHTLRDMAHVRERRLELRQSINQADIALYMSARLEFIASRHRKMLPWPDVCMRNRLIDKSEGLFQWATTVMEFLARRSDPDAEIASILALGDYSTPERAMDTLYTKVMMALPWMDDHFTQGYCIYMGTVLAAKEPLSCCAMRYLHPECSAEPSAIFAQLGSLVTGFNSDDEPVRILHSSLREFLLYHALPPFGLSSQEGTALLLLRCLAVINRELDPVADYLELKQQEMDDMRPIPYVSRQQIGDGQHYACSFWVDHLLDVEHVGPDLNAHLRDFISTRVFCWVTLSVCLGKFPNLQRLCTWFESHFTAGLRSSVIVAPLSQRRDASRSKESYVWSQLCRPRVILTLNVISARLCSNGRMEEALLATQNATYILRHPYFMPGPRFQDQLGDALTQAARILLLMGRVEEASTESQNAVALHRQVSSRPLKDKIAVWRLSVKASSEPSSTSLAGSLYVLARVLSKSGALEAALNASEESVVLYRGLPLKERGAFKAYLATSLNGHSGHLSAVGKREMALTTIEEAVTLRRELATQRSAQFNGDLAASLNDLSVYLSDVGKRDAALAAVQEAVQLRRQLVTIQPAAFTSDLALSLHNLSNRLLDFGKTEKALAAVEEAVKLRRQLATVRPAAFNSDLSMSLSTLSACLQDVGKLEEALTVMEEAVKLMRQLSVERPAAFASTLAIALHNLSVHLWGVGKQNAALNAIEEAVKIRRQLAAEQPGLASSLANLSVYWSYVGSRETALTAIEEAVNLYRRLAAAQPDAFNEDLAGSLVTLSNRLADMGQGHLAQTVIEEAVEIYRLLAAERPASLTGGLARALNTLSNRLVTVGKTQEALTAVEEAVKLHRQLAIERPAVFNYPVADSLFESSKRLSSLERHSEAMRDIMESIGLFRILVKGQPDFFNPPLAACLDHFSSCLSEASSYGPALTAAQEAVSLRRRFARTHPDRFNPELSTSLYACSRALYNLDQLANALAAIQEALALLRPIALALPLRFNRDLKKQLQQLSSVLLALDDIEGCWAAGAQAEEVEVW